MQFQSNTFCVAMVYSWRVCSVTSLATTVMNITMMMAVILMMMVVLAVLYLVSRQWKCYYSSYFIVQKDLPENIAIGDFTF